MLMVTCMTRHSIRVFVNMNAIWRAEDHGDVSKEFVFSHTS